MVEHIWKTQKMWNNKNHLRCIVCDVVKSDFRYNGGIVFYGPRVQTGLRYTLIEDPGCTPDIAHLAKRFLDARA